MIKHARYSVNNHLFNRVNALLSDKLKKRFDDMTAKSNRTDYNKLKQLPKSPSVTHFKELITHHQWHGEHKGRLKYSHSYS